MLRKENGTYLLHVPMLEILGILSNIVKRSGDTFGNPNVSISQIRGQSISVRNIKICPRITDKATYLERSP